MARDISFRLLSLLVAWNYFSFQVEPFEEEYEKNNPLPSATPAFADWPYNWESFGKNNVPSAQSFEALIAFVPLAPLPVHAETRKPEHPPFLRIRDKSPPVPSSSL
jgi:hypothetical protein